MLDRAINSIGLGQGWKLGERRKTGVGRVLLNAREVRRCGGVVKGNTMDMEVESV